MKRTWVEEGELDRLLQDWNDRGLEHEGLEPEPSPN